MNDVFMRDSSKRIRGNRKQAKDFFWHKMVTFSFHFLRGDRLANQQQVVLSSRSSQGKLTLQEDLRKR